MPCEISTIEHRKECNPLDENGMLPLFTAPMDSVVGEENFEKFTEEMIYAILPRTVELSKRVEFSVKGLWSAYSLKEFENVFCNEREVLDSKGTINALIDVANGHMKKILDLVRSARNIYGDRIVLMAGNIANPLTYQQYADVGIDYLRVGIGGGNCCTTQSNTAIGCGMASLIDAVYTIKKKLADIKVKRNGEKELRPKYSKLPKIVADGGVRNFSDIIKAISLGADYVMIGSVFSKMIESSAVKTCTGNEWYKLPLSVRFEDLTDFHLESNGWYGKYNGKDVFLGTIKATIYGMASREGQIAIGGAKTKTSEGIKKEIYVDYTMRGWCENFMDFLRSAMSYIGVRALDEMRDNAITVINSQNAIMAVNK